MIYCVALTGTTASGKSTVLSFFKHLKVPVISADKIARELTAKGQPAYLAIQEKFGDFAFDENGELIRSALRKRILYHTKDRVWLEKLLHPLIRERIEKDVLSLTNHAYCVVEIPLLMDCEDYPYINRVLLLLSERETQIERLMNRDECDYDHAAILLSLQPDERLRRALSDDILINTGSLDHLREEVKELHRKYLLLANEI